MSDDASERALSRRDCLRYGGVAIGSGALAGCLTGNSGDSGGESADASPDPETATDTATPSPTETETPSPTETAEPTETTAQSYAVSMQPVGEVTFEEPPETIVGGWGFVGDVLMALGHAEKIVGLSRPGFWYQGFYEFLPDVSMIDTTEIPNTVTEGYEIQEELLYELDPDLIATDPNRYISWYSVDEQTVERFADDIAPFFGNESRSARGSEWPNWPDGEAYDYYSVTEFVELYGEVMQEQERAAAMIELYESAIDDITSRLPPEDERPSIGLLSAFRNPDNGGYFGVNDPIPDVEKTHELKQYRDLGVVDAFAGQYSDEGHYDLTVGFEGLLETDPDVLVFDEAVNALGGHTVYGNTEAYEQTLELLRTDEVGQQLTAVQNERLYPGGTGSQGPIINLFQTEMLAKQLYPDEFGPWRGLGETPEDEQLFDRQRVAEIVRGDL